MKLSQWIDVLEGRVYIEEKLKIIEAVKITTSKNNKQGNIRENIIKNTYSIVFESKMSFHIRAFSIVNYMYYCWTPCMWISLPGTLSPT